MGNNHRTIDAPSYNNQFGWEKIGGEELAIPVIVRTDCKRYSPVRIVEQEIIKRYDSLPQALFQIITLKSFYLTHVEAKLLNTINFNHSNHRYGEQFFSSRDVIISAEDVKELSRFLNLSQFVFSQNLVHLTNTLGIIRLVTDPSQPSFTLLVPYIYKNYNGTECRFVPEPIVGNYTDTSKSVKAHANDWNVMYLKMLSIFCNNNSLHQIIHNVHIIRLDGLLYKNTSTPIIYEQFTG